MHGCQWVGPEQDPHVAPLEFCGRVPLWPGRNYCEDHVWRVYKQGTAIGMNRKNKAIEKELAEVARLEAMEDE